MQKYPAVNIYLDKIKENAKQMKKICSDNSIKVSGVVKGSAGDIKIIEAFINGGLTQLADSRIENLKKIKDTNFEVETLLLRLPDPNDAERTVKYADISLNSELKSMKSLSEAAKKINKKHKVIIMVDVGDLREGVMPEDLENIIKQAINFSGIEVIGLGTNVGCYGGVLPTYKNTKKLVDLKEKLEKLLNIKLPVISGGNTATTVLFEKNELPKGVNNFRIGEGIMQGTDATHQRDLPGFNKQNITLSAPIIELKEKPSVPTGTIGYDAFGGKPSFEDKGIRLRAILKVGRQDVRINGLTPILNGVEIIGASSDHLLLDVTDSEKDLKVGDNITFELGYGSMLSAMTSNYISKKYI